MAVKFTRVQLHLLDLEEAAVAVLVVLQFFHVKLLLEDVQFRLL